MEHTLPATPKTEIPWRIFGVLILTAIAWLAAYNIIQPLANWLSYDLLGARQGFSPGQIAGVFLL